MKIVVKRLGTARAFPPGSAARAELNKSAITSEYMPSHRYVVVEDFLMSDGTPHPTQPLLMRSCRTLDEAQLMVAP